ncbi:MAG: ABC transporter permease, partial [Planctomycetes bacterium]|nr:ABC transporter permease [Planctomycetota bacterium]
MMRFSISTRYAIRSLTRHLRRTILSVVGVGLGCGVCIFIVSFVSGEKQMLIRAAAESGVGHLRVVPRGWVDTRDNALRLEDWVRTLEIIRSSDEVIVATPRARTEALLAFGTRVTGVEILGVDPASEPAANRLVRDVAAGRYLRAGEPGTTVVGRAVARRLRAEEGDDLMVTVAGKDGEMKSAMLRIAGIVETGSDDLDATICHVNLEDVERLTLLDGAGEVTLLVRDTRDLDTVARRLRGAIGDDNCVVTWEEITPELAAGLEVDKTWTRLTVGIVMLVVLLGIASSQLAAILERRREFAVLSALGMKGRRLVLTLLTEGLFLGAAGGAVGLGLGAAGAYWIATHGIDFSGIYGDADLTMSNLIFDPVFYGDFGWWLVPLAFGL